MHTLKRRKLTHSTSPIISDGPFSLPTPLQLGTKAVVCTSCHRAFPGAKQSQLVQCALCHAPTCTICSRTCNGCPPSVPPTPELTMSPATVSPASPDVVSSDTPASLSLSFGNLNSDSHGLDDGRRPALASHTNMTGTVGKRRKVREHEDDREEGRKGLGEAGDEREKEGILPGCGRIVCRGCSFETPESDLNTCYDCAGRSPAPIQT
ncbi:hypothetical protein LXA43DRAFT_894376 [Ganoderma leucocontextum]|nr:hypothetical protein LXA43DRAFT_894376 [Ganoderma leucocontextum]